MQSKTVKLSCLATVDEELKNQICETKERIRLHLARDTNVSYSFNHFPSIVRRIGPHKCILLSLAKHHSLHRTYHIANHMSFMAYAASYSLQQNRINTAMALQEEINPTNCLFVNISKTLFGANRTSPVKWISLMLLKVTVAFTVEVISNKPREAFGRWCFW